jgi:hypothetical protein
LRIICDVFIESKFYFQIAQYEYQFVLCSVIIALPFQPKVVKMQLPALPCLSGRQSASQKPRTAQRILKAVGLGISTEIC